MKLLGLTVLSTDCLKPIVICLSPLKPTPVFSSRHDLVVPFAQGQELMIWQSMKLLGLTVLSTDCLKPIVICLHPLWMSAFVSSSLFRHGLHGTMMRLNLCLPMLSKLLSSKSVFSSLFRQDLRNTTVAWQGFLLGGVRGVNHCTALKN